MTAARVLAALESGPMISVTSRRSAAERRAIAEFVSGKPIARKLELKPPQSAMCPAAPSRALASAPVWTGWGQGSANTRFQSQPGFTAAEVPRLKLKWAFAFPGDLTSFAQAVVNGDRLYTGSSSGLVYSLDVKSGCIHWYFQADSWVRAAVNLGMRTTGGGASLLTAYFGDGVTNVYAVDAASSSTLLWKVKVDNYPVARVTGSPTLYRNVLYVPVASGEEGAGAAPDYQCCKFRGALAALRAQDGTQIWKTYVVDEPKPTTKNKSGTQLWGPSGAPIWSSPTIDEKRGAVYVTTGDNYSDPATRTSDAFMAMDLATGKILWSRQMTPGDSYNVGCRMPDTTNCPSVDGPDLDFSSSPILVDLPNGKRALVAGQKSGVVHAIDPDNQGEVIWQTRVGKGGSLGGVQWGSAVDANNVYVALADIGRDKADVLAEHRRRSPKKGGGMFALRLTDGKQVWRTRNRQRVQRSSALQPGAIRRGQRDSGRCVFRLRRRAPARVFDDQRQSGVGLRHGARLSEKDGQRCAGQRWLTGWGRPGDRRRDAIRELRLSNGRRNSGQRTAGFFGGREIASLSLDFLYVSSMPYLFFSA